MDALLPMKGLRSLKEKETAIEDVVCEYFSYVGIGVKKIPMAGYYDEKTGTWRKHKNPYVAVGHSDLILLYHGNTTYVEMKTQEGRQTKDQISFQEWIRHYGGSYYICRSLDDAKNIAIVVKSR